MNIYQTETEGKRVKKKRVLIKRLMQHLVRVFFVLAISEFPLALQAYMNNQSPDVVIGGLSAPGGVCSDGTRLYIADSGHSKILIYNSIPTSNNPTADVVLSGFFLPAGVNSDGIKLYIADTFFNRVLIYNSIPTNSSALADVIISGLNKPADVFSDGTRLF